MPRVFRQQYTRPIPEDAERVTTKNKKGQLVPAVRFKGPDGKTVVAPLTKKGDRCRLPSPTWYGWVKGKAVPLCTNKAAAEQLLAEKVRKAERGEAGLEDEHRQRPLAEHLADYEKELRARNNDPRYVDLAVSRIRATLEGCGFHCLAEMSASRVMAWLADLRQQEQPPPPLEPGKELYRRAEAAAALGMTPTGFRDAVKRHRLPALGKGPARRYPRASVEAVRALLGQGRSIQTTNYYLSHLKSFCNWMVEDERLEYSPLARLKAGSVEVDRRHDRRELEADELRRLLAATIASPRPFRGLTGRDRYALYATACGTGFRAGALASLTPKSFDLVADPPTVTLAARRNKSRVLKVQPLPADVVDLLRDFLPGHAVGRSIWPGTWARDGKGAEMLRLDLEAAGIPYVVEGPDGPLFADFHALRHTYLTLGGRAGIDLRTLQELAGHSTSTLTERYSHRRLHDLAGAVERLPNFLPQDNPEEGQALRATGTDPGGAYRPLTSAPDSACPQVKIAEETASPTSSEGPERNSGRSNDLIATDDSCEVLTQEAPPGFEPGMADLQSAALRPQEPLPDQPCASAGAALTGPLQAPADPDLARVLEAWPTLPAALKAALAALVGSKREGI